MGDVKDRGRPRSGAFIITREEIEEQHPRYLTDLLVLVPGVRVDPSPEIGNAVSLRGGCRVRTSRLARHLNRKAGSR